MNTALQFNSFHVLMIRYSSPVVSLETIIKDYFTHMKIEDANRRANKMDLPFPVFKSEDSKKAKWMVNIVQFAAYLDRQSQTALKDHEAMHCGQYAE
ncbi:pyocin activator PrtN family protein [Acinetobacter johnsonii]|uniref:pyocin activator PrtN family protein n=1 Tax=Acinetobacter johnsonii TaxID=40214 RepID=UPI0030170059